MPRTRIKICGIRDIATALAAAEAGADAIGLVFVEKSPRAVAIAAARAIIAALPAFVEPVALFANATADRVRTVTQAIGVRTVQLHGSEHPQEVERLSEFRVIKAVNFGTPACEAWIKGPRPANVGAVLVDAPQETSAAGETLAGGSGKAFDWTQLAAVVGGAHPTHAADVGSAPPTQTGSAAFAGAAPRLILAGGLTPENVAEAIRIVKPWAVDVSSGVESSRGVKDAGKIRAFCEAARIIAFD